MALAWPVFHKRKLTLPEHLTDEREGNMVMRTMNRQRWLWLKLLCLNCCRAMNMDREESLLQARVMTIIRVNNDGPRGGMLVVCPKQDLLGFYWPFWPPTRGRGIQEDGRLGLAGNASTISGCEVVWWWWPSRSQRNTQPLQWLHMNLVINATVHRPRSSNKRWIDVLLFVLFNF
jgi:hypothetical protein